MGYTTDFEGTVAVDPPLNQHEIAYLRKFAETRRMDREQGPYFVDGSGFAGHGPDADVRDHNMPPAGQPGLWCQWVPAEDGAAIEWDGGEKFYCAEEWMRYLIEHFLRPGAHASADSSGCFEGFTFDHVLSGVIDAQGEDDDDRWRLVVQDNRVSRESR